MKKPHFEFNHYSIDEAYALIDLYRNSAASDESNLIVDLTSFFSSLDQIKDSLTSGKKFKSFPKLPFGTKQYCADLYNYVESLWQDLLNKNSASISKQKMALAKQNEKQEIFAYLDNSFSRLTDSSVYPLNNQKLEITKEYLNNNQINKQYFFKEYEKIISNRNAILDNGGSIFYPEIAQYFTIIETDKILVENGMKEYGIYEITRSNHPGITKGINFYSFDKDDNLLIMSPPYRVIESIESRYIVFDSKLYDSNKVVSIPKSDIVSYKLYGTELMQSTVSTNSRLSEVQVIDNNLTSKYQRPSISGTFFSSLLFGSTFTLLNGVGKALHEQTNVLGNKLDGLSGKLDSVVDAINNISITTDHKIIDTSRVQIVLTNRRDLEIDGINIFYDLNRVYPNLDSLKTPPIKEVEHKNISESSSNIADEVLKLKQLLDQGVIDEEEFKAMKKKLIS
jgi:hypothetical protein